jgi:hypothetical protein
VTRLHLLGNISGYALLEASMGLDSVGCLLHPYYFSLMLRVSHIQVYKHYAAYRSYNE